MKIHRIKGEYHVLSDSRDTLAKFTNIEHAAAYVRSGGDPSYVDMSIEFCKGTTTLFGDFQEDWADRRSSRKGSSEVKLSDEGYEAY